MDKTLEQAIALSRLGFAVHWLQPCSKAPLVKGWSMAPVLTEEELTETHQRRYNAGFRAGRWSVVDGKEICVLDVDIRGGEAFAAEAYAVADQLAQAPFTVRSGSGIGRHYYLSFPIGQSPEKAATTLRQSKAWVHQESGQTVPEGTEGAKPAWLIEILSTGKNVVMPPSIHPETQQPYEWNGSMKPIDVPQAILDLIDMAEGKLEWDAPSPVQHELPPVPSITAAMLPTPLQPFLLDIVRRMQCPLEYVAVTLVCALGVVIGTSVVVHPKRRDNWIEAPNLWGAVVGPPGRMKSPAISAAQRPLFYIDKLNQTHFEQAQSGYELQKMQAEFQEAQLKEELRNLTRPSKKGAAPSARTPQQVQKDLLNLKTNQPVAPTCARNHTNDATVEALGILMEKNPTGVLVYQDELMGLLASFEKAGRESDRQHYLTGWNGLSAIHVDRVGRKHLYINPFCISVFGGIQPDRLAKYMAESMSTTGNDGLIQRFQLLVYPNDPPPTTTVDFSPDLAAEDNMNKLFFKLAYHSQQLGATVDPDVKKPFFQFDEQAQPALYQWLDDLERKVSDQEHPIMSEHLGKYRKLVPALALIFHVCDIATDVLTPGTPIPLRTFELAVAWSEVLEQHARRVHSISTNVTIQAAVALAKKIKAGKLQDGFTQRDVHHRQWTCLKDIDVVRGACNELVEAHWLRPIKREKVGPGRPQSPAYEINPKL